VGRGQGEGRVLSLATRAPASASQAAGTEKLGGGRQPCACAWATGRGALFTKAPPSAFCPLRLRNAAHYQFPSAAKQLSLTTRGLFAAVIVPEAWCLCLQSDWDGVMWEGRVLCTCTFTTLPCVLV